MSEFVTIPESISSIDQFYLDRLLEVKRDETFKYIPSIKEIYQDKLIN